MQILVNPKRIKPPHEVNRKRVFKKLYHSIKRTGWIGTPLVVVQMIRTIRWDYYALNGSHRIAAARKANKDIPVIVLPSSFSDDIKKTDFTNLFVDVYEDADIFINDRDDYYQLPWGKYKLAARILAAERI